MLCSIIIQVHAGQKRLVVQSWAPTGKGKGGHLTPLEDWKTKTKNANLKSTDISVHQEMH